jgi:hypothetical protein
MHWMPIEAVESVLTTSTLWIVPNGMKADLNPAAVALSANPPTYTTLLDVMATCASCCGCGCGGCG